MILVLWFNYTRNQIFTSSLQVTSSQIEVVTRAFRERIGQSRFRIRLGTFIFSKWRPEKTLRRTKVNITEFTGVEHLSQVRWKKTLSFTSQSNELPQEFDRVIRELNPLYTQRSSRL